MWSALYAWCECRVPHTQYLAEDWAAGKTKMSSNALFSDSDHKIQQCVYIGREVYFTVNIVTVNLMTVSFCFHFCFLLLSVPLLSDKMGPRYLNKKWSVRHSGERKCTTAVNVLTGTREAEDD